MQSRNRTFRSVFGSFVRLVPMAILSGRVEQAAVDVEGGLASASNAVIDYHTDEGFRAFRSGALSAVQHCSERARSTIRR